MDKDFFFIYISEKYLQFEKKSKVFFKENVWFTIIFGLPEVAGSVYCRIIFQTMYILKIHT